MNATLSNNLGSAEVAVQVALKRPVRNNIISCSLPRYLDFGLKNFLRLLKPHNRTYTNVQKIFCDFRSKKVAAARFSRIMLGKRALPGQVAAGSGKCVTTPLTGHLKILESSGLGSRQVTEK